MEWKSRLVGDKGKDHEKALDIETKVAKAYRLQSTPRPHTVQEITRAWYSCWFVASEMFRFR